VCGKEFEEGSNEVTLFLGGEDAEAVAPRPGLWKDGVVVGVGSWWEGPDRLEVGEGEVHRWVDAWFPDRGLEFISWAGEMDEYD